MGQVPASTFKSNTPPTYLLIGSGRLARHFSNYFSLENMAFVTWSRSANSTAELENLTGKATHILLMISDAAIEPFCREHAEILGLHDGNQENAKTVVHFSGALSLENVPSVHPLMSFSHALYGLEQYRKIPFILERGHASLGELLPGLINPHFEIESSLKPLYHALCVLSGNGTVLLWEKAKREFSEKLGLPPGVLNPYLGQTCLNLLSAEPGASVLTGPIARGDSFTIAKNLQALSGDPFENVYRSFTQTSAMSASVAASKGAPK
jgi:hypothetical protein